MTEDIIQSSKANKFISELEPKPKFTIEVVEDPETLLQLEFERTQWYLEHFSVYQKQGYGKILRWPKGITPGTQNSEDQIKKVIKEEIAENFDSYVGYAGKLKRSLEVLIESGLPVTSTLYGFPIEGNYKVAPTAYAVIAGQMTKDSPIFFRLPKFHPSTLGDLFSTGKYRSDLGLLTHEIFNHGITAHLRDGTAIDESNPKCSHQLHKERLMDLLGRTILTRAGLMKRDSVAMQVRPAKQASSDIDSLYYSDPANPSEAHLTWEGDLKELISRVDTVLTA